MLDVLLNIYWNATPSYPNKQRWASIGHKLALDKGEQMGYITALVSVF